MSANFSSPSPMAESSSSSDPSRPTLPGIHEMFPEVLMLGDSCHDCDNRTARPQRNYHHSNHYHQPGPPHHHAEPQNVPHPSLAESHNYQTNKWRLHPSEPIPCSDHAPPSSQHGSQTNLQHFGGNLSNAPLPAERPRVSYPFPPPFPPNGFEDDEFNSATESNDTATGKKHICPTCSKRFNRPSSLKIHINTHTGATPFKCPWPDCGREFNVNSNMRRHYRNHTTPGFSRGAQLPDAMNPIPNDGRRKRRRVRDPGPPYQPSQQPGLSYPQYLPYPRHPSDPYPYPYPYYRHPNPQQHMIPSPPITNSSVSDDESSSESDLEDDRDPHHQGRPGNCHHAKIAAYGTSALTHSLARVAPATTSVRAGGDHHPYPRYANNGGGPNDNRNYEHADPHGQSLLDQQRRRKDQTTHRPLTPGSMISRSPSPAPPPQLPRGNSNGNNAHTPPKYNASTPYVRSLADSHVSTTLRPVFSRDRQQAW